MSKYRPVSAQNDYLYYIEHHPVMHEGKKKARWENCKYGIPCNYTNRRPSSSGYNQVLYSNPQFTADSSQATLHFENEIDSNRFKGYKTYRKPSYDAKWISTNNHSGCIPLHHSHVSIPKNARLNAYTSRSQRYENNVYYDYRDPWRTHSPNNHFSEEDEEGSGSEILEDEYTDSEQDYATYNKYQPKPIINPKANIREKKTFEDSAPYAEKMMKKINMYNQYQPGKKMQIHDLDTMKNHLQKNPVINEKYVYKKSRCLDSTYEKAADLLKTSKIKSGHKEPLKDSNNFSPYDQYRRWKYSQLLFNDSTTDCRYRESANEKNTHKEPEKQLTNAHSSNLESHATTEKINAPSTSQSLPDKQLDHVQIKTITKPSESEQPVKLQKENGTDFASVTLLDRHWDKLPPLPKRRLSILNRSKRIPRRKRNFVSIFACAKALKKFTENSQVLIEKEAIAPSNSAQVVDIIDQVKPTLSSERTTALEQHSQPSLKKCSSAKSFATSVASNAVTVDVNNMISKLDEIETLINSKKCPYVKTCGCSTSQSSFNTDNGTSTSLVVVPVELPSDISKKSGKKSKERTPTKASISEYGKRVNAKPKVSPKPTTSGFRSIKSTANTKSSKNKSISKCAIVNNPFESVFNLNQEMVDTSKSQFTEQCSEPSTYKLDDICNNSSATSCNSSRKQQTFTTNARKKRVKIVSKGSSLVTVFPALIGNAELTAESATTNLTTEMIHKNCESKIKTSNIPQLQCRSKVDDTSSENASIIVRPKRGRKRGSVIISVPEERRLPLVSGFNSLRSVFCIIVGFLYRYFRSVFLF